MPSRHEKHDSRGRSMQQTRNGHADPVADELKRVEREAIEAAIEAQNERKGLSSLYTWITSAIIARSDELRAEERCYLDEARDAGQVRRQMRSTR